MLYLIVKILSLVESLMEHFVAIQVQVNGDVDGEWTGTIISDVTPKGERIIGALSTLIDNSLVMLAQLSTMFPSAQNNGWYNTTVTGN